MNVGKGDKTKCKLLSTRQAWLMWHRKMFRRIRGQAEGTGGWD